MGTDPDFAARSLGHFLDWFLVFIGMRDRGVGASLEARTPTDPTVADGHRAARVDTLQSHENKAETKSNRR